MTAFLKSDIEIESMGFSLMKTNVVVKEFWRQHYPKI